MAVIHLGVTQIYQFINTDTSEAAALNYKGIHLNLLATFNVVSLFQKDRRKT